MRRKYLLLIVLLVLALLPYFIICFYALPFADDFCFAWTSLEKISFTERFLRQYLHFCGRYSADALLCIHPLATGRLVIYQSTFLSSLIATLVALFLFIRHFIKDFLKAAIIALIVLLFYLCYMPQLVEGIYWFTGISNYSLGLTLLLLHAVCVLVALRFKATGKVLLPAIAAVLLTAAIGINELNATLIPAWYLLIIIVLYGNRTNGDVNKRYRKLAVGFFIIALVSSAFVIFSPGNFARSEEFKMKFQLAHSLFYALAQTGRFVATWLFTIPALILSASVLAKADKAPDTPFFRFDYKIILALALFTVFMGAFLPYYGTGILGQHRTINYVFFLFILQWIWMLVSFGKKHALCQKLAPYTADSKGLALIAICIIVMMCTANGGRVLRDFSEDNFTNYKLEFMQRQSNLLHHPETEPSPLKNIPRSFQIVDARNDSTWWVDKCMKYFYRDTGIELK